MSEAHTAPVMQIGPNDPTAFEQAKSMNNGLPHRRIADELRIDIHNEMLCCTIINDTPTGPVFVLEIADQIEQIFFRHLPTLPLHPDVDMSVGTRQAIAIFFGVCESAGMHQQAQGAGRRSQDPIDAKMTVVGDADCPSDNHDMGTDPMRS